MQTISRTKVDQTKAYIWTKDGLPYHYGGSGNPGGDCSWFACAGAASLLGLKVNQRYGSTENFNRPGQYGATATAPAAVLGMVHAKSKSEVPAAAVLKMGFLHGGGGENSHVSSTIDGLNFESRGLYRGRSGHVVADSARAWNDSLFGDWWYLPFTVGPVDPNAFPLPDGYVYGWATGPDWMISCRFGESSDWQAGLRRIQIALGVPASGVYDELTAAATKTVQARTPGLLPDGSSVRRRGRQSSRPAPRSTSSPPATPGSASESPRAKGDVRTASDATPTSSGARCTGIRICRRTPSASAPTACRAAACSRRTRPAAGSSPSATSDTRSATSPDSPTPMVCRPSNAASSTSGVAVTRAASLSTERSALGGPQRVSRLARPVTPSPTRATTTAARYSTSSTTPTPGIRPAR